MMAHKSWNWGLDHAPTYENVLMNTLGMRFSSDAVSQPWPAQVEKKHQEWREAYASNKGVQRFKWPKSSVDITVNETSYDEHRYLCDEKTDQYEPEHGTNGLPGC